MSRVNRTGRYVYKFSNGTMKMYTILWDNSELLLRSRVCQR